MEMNRRDFLLGAGSLGALGAFGALAGCAPAPKQASENLSNTGSSSQGALHTWEVAPEPITDIVETRDYDVVVVGAGMGGLATAEAAARNGAKVVVIEKMPQISFRGQDVAGINSTWQREQGIELDPELAAYNLHLWTHQTANYDLIYGWAKNCGRVIDHVQSLVELNGYELAYGMSSTSKVNWDKDEFPEKYREYPSPISFPDASIDYNSGYGSLADLNKGVAESLWKAAEADGAEFLFNTKAEQLVGDAASGITGVIVTDDAGNHVQFNAAKGVVLATGDIAGNQEMIDAFCPIANRAGVHMYTPEGGNTGDGILMGAWAGAALQRTMAAPMIHQFCPDSFENFLDSFIMSWMAVNVNGDRYASEMNFEPYVTNARMAQPGNVSWSIFDSDWKEHFKVQWPTKYDYWINQIEEGDQLNKGLESGYLTKCDTIEEVAEVIGCPVDRLTATVEKYNAACDAGVDTQFHTPAQFMAPVKTAPFYVVPVAATLLIIPFGLHVDRNSQVLTEEDAPIEGLYAVGNMQGDFYAYDYPVHYPGLSHSRSLTYGYFIGEALATDKKITDLMD